MTVFLAAAAFMFLLEVRCDRNTVLVARWRDTDQKLDSGTGDRNFATAAVRRSVNCWQCSACGNAWNTTATVDADPQAFAAEQV